MKSLNYPLNNKPFSYQLTANLTSDAYAFDTYSKISDTQTVNDASYYGANYTTSSPHGTSHTSIISANGDAVAVTSTINLL